MVRQHVHTHTDRNSIMCIYRKQKTLLTLLCSHTTDNAKRQSAPPLSLIVFSFCFSFLSFVCLSVVRFYLPISGCLIQHLLYVVFLFLKVQCIFLVLLYDCISASILYSMCLSISRYYCVLSLPLFYIEDAFLFLAIIVFYLYLSVRLLLSSFRVSRSQECLKTVVAHSVYFIILSFFYHSVYFVCLANIPFSCLSLSNSRFDCLLVFQRKRFFTWSLSIF